MSFPSLRKRVASQAIVTQTVGDIRPLPATNPPQSNITSGGFSRIMRGLFGLPNPESFGQSAQVAVPPPRAFYQFHEGDQFTAGSPSFVFEPTQESPVVTVWGRSFLRKPNTFLPYQPPQVFSDAHIVLAGLGGLQAGTFAVQSLEQSELEG